MRVAVQATPIPADEDKPVPSASGLEKYRFMHVNNMFILSEEPRVRLINWRRTTHFQLAMPWIHYKIEWYPQLKKYWLWEVYFSRTSLSRSTSVSYPFIPNFYKARPCAHPGMMGGASMEEAAMDLWMGSFNWDGQLAGRSGWQQIAQRAKVATTKRRAVLEYWDANLSVDDVLGLYYPLEAGLQVVKLDE